MFVRQIDFFYRHVKFKDLFHNITPTKQPLRFITKSFLTVALWINLNVSFSGNQVKVNNNGF